MGMAASQARLLSITSRLADNELRAQIVNNNKMRLATASSKASAAYVQALNDATMMISNYDAQGNALHTPLTFNSLTRYSQYNNQYGLSDVNGNLLVSEEEANMFKNAGGVLDAYLAAHGFEKSTTYFDSGIFEFVEGSDNTEIWVDDTHLESYPLEDIRTMYLGGVTSKGKVYDSYDVAVEDGQYGQYKAQQIAFTNAITPLEQKAQLQVKSDAVLSANSLFASTGNLNTDVQAVVDLLVKGYRDETTGTYYKTFNPDTVLEVRASEDGTVTNYTVQNLINDLSDLKSENNPKNGSEYVREVTNCSIYGSSSTTAISNIYLNSIKTFNVVSSTTSNSVDTNTIISAIDNNGHNTYDASESYSKNLLVYEENDKYYLFEKTNDTYTGTDGSHFNSNNTEYYQKNDDDSYTVYRKSNYYINKNGTNYDTLLLLSTNSVDTGNGNYEERVTAEEAVDVKNLQNKNSTFFIDDNNTIIYGSNDEPIPGLTYDLNSRTWTYENNGVTTDVTDRVYYLHAYDSLHNADCIDEATYEVMQRYVGNARLLYTFTKAPVNRTHVGFKRNFSSDFIGTLGKNVTAVLYTQNEEGNYVPKRFYDDAEAYSEWQYEQRIYTFGNDGSNSVNLDFTNANISNKTIFYDKNGNFIAAEDRNGNLYDSNGTLINIPSGSNAGTYLTENNVLFSAEKGGDRNIIFRTLDNRQMTNSGNYYYLPMGIGGDVISANGNTSLSPYCSFPSDNANYDDLSIDYKTRYRYIGSERYYLHVNYQNIKNDAGKDQIYYCQGGTPHSNFSITTDGIRVDGNIEPDQYEYQMEGGQGGSGGQTVDTTEYTVNNMVYDNDGVLQSFVVNNNAYQDDDNDGIFTCSGQPNINPSETFYTKTDLNKFSISFINDESLKSDEEIYAEVVKKCKEYVNLAISNEYLVDYYHYGDGTLNAQHSAYDKYTTAANTLITTLFGGSVGENTALGRYIYANLGNFTNGAWLFSDNNYVTDTEDDDHPNGHTLKSYMRDVINSDKFKQLEILDKLFQKYGAPNYTWIDKNDPNGNADNKVQWYINLFNRMCEGYKALEDGLASSNEWIEFALESGLVTMEQVDLNYSWNPTMYSNVCDITEVTDTVAVAKAEAEYNKAMRNIEAKDKRLDIELKNIDTEHNALQTEYEQIKNVISKNIERSFKIYS